MARDKAGRIVRAGIPGQADISGIMAPSGRRLEIECKSGTGRQTEAQKAWQRMIECMGGLYVVARTVADVDQALGGSANA